MAKVYITGLGFITSIGNSVEEVFHSLREMSSGIELHPDLQSEDSPVKVAGTIKGFDTASMDPEDWVYPDEYQLRRDVLRSFSPHVLYAWCAVQQAIKTSSLQIEDISNENTGMYTASAGSMNRIFRNFQQLEDRGVMGCNPMSIVSSISGTLSFNLISALKIRGFSCGQVSALSLIHI